MRVALGVAQHSAGEAFATYRCHPLPRLLLWATGSADFLFVRTCYLPLAMRERLHVHTATIINHCLSSGAISATTAASPASDTCTSPSSSSSPPQSSPSHHLHHNVVISLAHLRLQLLLLLPFSTSSNKLQSKMTLHPQSLGLAFQACQAAVDHEPASRHRYFAHLHDAEPSRDMFEFHCGWLSIRLRSFFPGVLHRPETLVERTTPPVDNPEIIPRFRSRSADGNARKRGSPQ